MLQYPDVKVEQEHEETISQQALTKSHTRAEYFGYPRYFVPAVALYAGSGGGK
jgi:hypothetical protein